MLDQTTGISLWGTNRVDSRRRGPRNQFDFSVGPEVTATRGDGIQRRWIRGGGPYQSNAAPEAHFGFPRDGSGPIAVRVLWPDGTVVEEIASPGRRLVIERASDDRGF